MQSTAKQEDFTLTEEQMNIINAVTKKNSILKIEALAGTGKTTTLMEIIRNYPDKKMLVFAFNNAIAKELRNKIKAFGFKNANATTLHGFAYKFFINNFFPYSERPMSKKDLMMELIEEYPSIPYDRLSVIYDTFEAICNSDIEIKTLKALKEDKKLVELFTKKVLIDNRQLSSKYYALGIAENTQRIAEMVKTAMEIYRKMEDKEISYTHSFYLKYTAENIKEQKKYDIVLVDEAQDINPVQMQLIKKINPAKVILVGDRHQAIYGWRGAVNSLQRIKTKNAYPLTGCFRFKEDSEQENLANVILSFYKGQKNLIKGQVKEAKNNNKTAHLFRTNAGMVFYILDADEKVRLVRPIDEIFREIETAQAMIDIVNGMLPRINLPIYLQKIAEEARNTYELLDKAALFDYSLSSTISMLLATEMRDEELYEEVVEKIQKNGKNYALTVHTAKGLEFDKVYIHDDFMSFETIMQKYIQKARINIQRADIEVQFNSLIKLIRLGSPLYKELEEEINLAYIAITRAKNKLIFEPTKEKNPIYQLIMLAEDDEYRKEYLEEIKEKLQEKLQEDPENQVKKTKKQVKQANTIFNYI